MSSLPKCSYTLSRKKHLSSNMRLSFFLSWIDIRLSSSSINHQLNSKQFVAFFENVASILDFHACSSLLANVPL
jgi:hypothetical protein